MAQAATVSSNAIVRRDKKMRAALGGLCTRKKAIKQVLNLRTWFAILVGAFPLYLFRIETIVFRELRGNSEKMEEAMKAATSLRYGTTSSFHSKDIGSPEKSLIPVSRNGFLSRGSLRSPIVASPEQISITGKITFDYLELEKINYQQTKITGEVNEAQQEIRMPQESNPLPRTIAVNEIMGVAELVDGAGRLSSSKQAREMILKDILIPDDGDGSNKLFDFEQSFYKDCDRVLTTLPTVHPTCNNIHELHLATSDTKIALLSMKGSWRAIWKVDLDHRSKNSFVKDHKRSATNQTSSKYPSKSTVQRDQSISRSSSESAVLKTLHLHREFNRYSFEAHSKDIIVMDRLTASPYVVDAYGFCGQSVVTEFASSTGRDHVKRYDISSRERTKIARDLARGLVDVQALRPIPHEKILSNCTKDVAYNETPSIPVVFAHNDINIANTVMIDGRIKWNDFNIGVFMRKPKTSLDILPESSNERHNQQPNLRSNIKGDEHRSLTTASLFTALTEGNQHKIDQLCPAPVKYRSDMWRSPEEIKNVSYVQLAQTDIYGLANILYQTMTRHQPWTYKEPGGALTKSDIARKKLNGTIPTIPEQYLNTTKRELQVLFAATNLCFFPIPEKRPTAQRLAFGLGSLYEKLKHKERFTRREILDYLVPSKL